MRRRRRGACSGRRRRGCAQRTLGRATRMGMRGRMRRAAAARKRRVSLGWMREAGWLAGWLGGRADVSIRGAAHSRRRSHLQRLQSGWHPPAQLSLTVVSLLCTAAAAAADEEETLGAAAAAAAAAGGMQVERVAKDLGSLTSEQRLAAVQRDAPELLQLIAELREGLTEVRSRVGPLLNEVGGWVGGWVGGCAAGGDAGGWVLSWARDWGAEGRACWSRGLSHVAAAQCANLIQCVCAGARGRAGHR